VKGIVEVYATMARHCKEISEGKLPTLISPWMDGIKSVASFGAEIYKSEGITLAEHESEWDEIMAGISGAVDIVAFQDGHVDFHELPAYLDVNKKLAERHGLRCWTNSETFDRDMPIKFLPIKWEKLLLKLQAAAQVGVEKGITFEFSHFMSPNSCYLQAGHLNTQSFFCAYSVFSTVKKIHELHPTRPRIQICFARRCDSLLGAALDRSRMRRLLHLPGSGWVGFRYR
jgi:hypothetical protein